MPRVARIAGTRDGSVRRPDLVRVGPALGWLAGDPRCRYRYPPARHGAGRRSSGTDRRVHHAPAHRPHRGASVLRSDLGSVGRAQRVGTTVADPRAAQPDRPVLRSAILPRASPQHPVPPKVPGYADPDVADRLGGRHRPARQASRADRRLPRGGERSCARLSPRSRTGVGLGPVHRGNRVDLWLRAGRGLDGAPARRPVHEGGVRRAGWLGAFEHRRCGDVREESRGRAARALPPRPPPYG